MGTYNQERYVCEALDSALAQTYPHIEIIVVDDASKDRTVEILKGYGSRIRLLIREANSGGCQVPRNVAIQEARGEYIAFLDHDDAWYPEKLAKQVAFMEAHRDIPLCHTYCHVMDEASCVVGVRHEGRLPGTGDCFHELLRHCFITISSVMLRRDLFERVGGLFNEDKNLLSDDYEFFLRVARRYPIGLVDEILAKYRKSAAGVMSRHWRYQPDSVPFHRRVLENPPYWEGKASAREVRDVFIDACVEGCIYWRDRKCAQRALWFAWQAVAVSPGCVVSWREMFKSAVRPLIFWR